MGIVANEKIADIIKSKYGSLSDENIKRYFMHDFYISSAEYHITEDMYPRFKEELDKVIDAQNLSLDDVLFLGAGQTFSGIGIGDYVLKVGSKKVPVYLLPYRLSPIHEAEISDRVGVFVSQKADTRGITEKDVQDMYNLIRDTGGIWLDVKSENLGRVTKDVKPIDLGENQSENLNRFDADIPEYHGEIFLIDYEDVVYLTPSIRKQIVNYEPVNINSIKREVVKDNTDVDEMYFQGYIINSNKLLGYEERYQRQKGNIEKANRCRAQAKENERQAAQREYEIEQVYRQGRRPGTIGKKYSVKEIGIRAAQNTTFSRLKYMAMHLSEKMISKLGLFGKSNSKESNSIDGIDEEFWEDTDNSGNGFRMPTPDDLDPYTTR